jgi:double-stranded uracil-DNA glycosylase
VAGDPLTADAALKTLPDLLRDGLELVFVGINPSVFSARQGHYFARPTNRFWACLSRSVLSAPARRGLGVERLQPVHDRALAEYGIGFTDVVKRPTPKAADLRPADFAVGIEQLTTKLRRYRPFLACFHGITAYRPVHRALAPAAAAPELGLQTVHVGDTHLFVVPSPSGANAHVTPSEQVNWYDLLAECLRSLPKR